MRILPAALVSFGFAFVGLFVACTSEELNPGGSPRDTTDSGPSGDGASSDGNSEAAPNAGASCASILKCVQGCKTTQCATDCTSGASPKAKGIIEDLQACTTSSKQTAPCLSYCTVSDGGGGGDGGDGGGDGGADAGPVTGPDTTVCSLCVLQVCKPKLDACAADK